MRSLEPNLREHAFFLCWTRKEAYVKATGDGLFASLSGFRVTLRPTESAKLVHVARDTNEAKAWTLHDLDLADGYAAAVAYRDAERQVAVLPIVEPSELLTFALHCKEGRGRGPSSFL